MAGGGPLSAVAPLPPPAHRPRAPPRSTLRSGRPTPLTGAAMSSRAAREALLRREARRGGDGAVTFCCCEQVRSCARSWCKTRRRRWSADAAKMVPLCCASLFTLAGVSRWCAWTSPSSATGWGALYPAQTSSEVTRGRTSRWALRTRSRSRSPPPLHSEPCGG